MTTDSPITRRLAKFRVESLLSEGSLGPVYLARDLALDRPVALLVVPRAIAGRSGFRDLFLTAVRAAAGLHHPSIAALYEIAEYDGEFYLSAEYVSGLSLDSYLQRLSVRRQVIQVDEAIFLIKQAADALVYAHGAGVAHGDIRPERLFINRLPQPTRTGEPPLRAKITGFGLAAVQHKAASDDHETGAAATLPPTASLEDVQALAMVFSQMIMGISAPALQHGGQMDSEQRVARLPGDPAVSDFTPAVANILERALAVQPDLRFQSAEELREALAEASGSFSDRRARQTAPVVSGVSFAALPAASTELRQPEPPPAAAFGSGALLVVSHPDQGTESYRLDQPTYALGRSNDNDIVLPAGGVSRRHLQLVAEGGVWLITDLASTNSTLVEGEAVQPNAPRIWRSGETLSVGPYTMRWLPGLVELQSSRFEPTPTAAVTSRLTVELAPARLQPGEQAHFQLSIFNGYPTARRLRLAVDGIPDSWLKIGSETLTLQPGSETKTPLIITPPRSSDSTAGRWSFMVRAVIENGESERLSSPASITLLPFVHYTGSLQPGVLRDSRTCRLILRNNGNTTTTFNIQGAAQDNQLSIVAAPPVVRLAPGQDGESDLSLAVRRRPFWGSARLARFQVEITSPGARTLTLPGHFLLKPLLTPRRLLFALATLFILALLTFLLVNWPT